MTLAETSETFEHVHISVGTFASNYYMTACGLSAGDYMTTRLAARELATCQACLDVFSREKK